MRLAEIIQIYMKLNGLGTRGMGEVFGVSAATISRFLSGKQIDGQLMQKMLVWLFETPSESDKTSFETFQIIGMLKRKLKDDN